jgi:RNA polymerase sigma-70 factor (ECF subfamily)
MHLVSVDPLRPGSLALALDDTALAARAKSDDTAAFTALYLRYARYIAGVAFQLLGDDAEVDDIVQETFVDAREGLSGLEEPAAIRRWLVVIAIRRVRRLLGRRRIRRWYARRVAEVTPRASDPREVSSVEELYDALDRLPDKLRVPWILTRIGDMALDHAADACDVSVATLKRRVALADERLARRLAE